MRRNRGEYFRPAVPPYAVVDNYLNGAVVLIVGHWVNEDGREIAAEVSGTTARRRLTDLSPIPPCPAFKPIEDGR
ncbi:MAG: hypothetical protein ACKVQR_04310 [Aquabacterium sp.]